MQLHWCYEIEFAHRESKGGIELSPSATKPEGPLINMKKAVHMLPAAFFEEWRLAAGITRACCRFGRLNKV